MFVGARACVCTKNEHSGYVRYANWICSTLNVRIMMLPLNLHLFYTCKACGDISDAKSLHSLYKLDDFFLVAATGTGICVCFFSVLLLSASLWCAAHLKWSNYRMNSIFLLPAFNIACVCKWFAMKIMWHRHEFVHEYIRTTHRFRQLQLRNIYLTFLCACTYVFVALSLPLRECVCVRECVHFIY